MKKTADCEPQTHELLDRACSMNEIWEVLITSHPLLQKYETLHDEAQRVGDEIADFYQKVGSTLIK